MSWCDCYRSGWVYRLRNGGVDQPIWLEATEDAAIPFEWEFDDLRSGVAGRERFELSMGK
jgi:hypothetical protein